MIALLMALAFHAQIDQAKRAIRPPLPPLPGTSLFSQTNLPIRNTLAAKGISTITLAWECVDYGSNLNAILFTGLDATSNLVDWTEVASLSYAVSNSVTLSNQPPMQSYRAKIGFK